MKGTHYTSDCKHKHMLESGAPPHKFDVPYIVCNI